VEQTLLDWQAAARQRWSGLLDSRIGALVAESRPWFWPVGWVPAYVGTVVANHSLVPDLPRALLALLILGPLVWGIVLIQNDLHDRRTDELNARKATAPLVLGTVTVRELTWLGRVLVVVAIGAGLLIGPLYALGVATVLALGWAYSAPPVRLKSRPGADVAVNAVVIGVLAPLAGWSLTRPPREFPWLLGLFGLLFAAAFYLPTTVVDRPADRSAGDTTFAVRFGPQWTFRAGLALWVAALLGALLCARLDVFVPSSSLPYQAAMAPVLTAGYVLLARRPSILRLACLSVLFGIPTIGFITGYLG
jgi:lycopene elongase/hydratase (dihydrobisanhydrobacterioruberin-forming)